MPGIPFWETSSSRTIPRSPSRFLSSAVPIFSQNVASILRANRSILVDTYPRLEEIRVSPLTSVQPLHPHTNTPYQSPTVLPPTPPIATLVLVLKPPSRIILHTPQYTPYNIPHPHTSHTTNQPLNTPTACLQPPPPPPNPVTAATTLLHPNRYVYHTYVSEGFSLSTHRQHRPAQSSVAGETHNGTASTSAVREGALVSWEKMRGISYGTSLRG